MVKNKKSKDFDVLKNNTFSEKINIVESFETSFINGDITFEYGLEKRERMLWMKKSKALAEMFTSLVQHRNKSDYGTYLLIAENLYDLLIEFRVQGRIKGNLSDESIKIENAKLRKTNILLRKELMKLLNMRKLSYKERKDMK